MEKRYQVFISSTFQDLQNARQEVSQALLRADCFPAGMELFPAADEEQFEFIKTVIDQSDYYIIISAGRYGSIHPETGLSFTEMEYDYAVETGKPVIRLLHKDPFGVDLEFDSESESEAREKLRDFRKKVVDSGTTFYWNKISDLQDLTQDALSKMSISENLSAPLSAIQSLSISTRQGTIFICSKSVRIEPDSNQLNEYFRRATNSIREEWEFEFKEDDYELANFLCSDENGLDEQALADLQVALDEKSAAVYFGSLIEITSKILASPQDTIRAIAKLKGKTFRTGIFRIGATIVVIHVATGIGQEAKELTNVVANEISEAVSEISDYFLDLLKKEADKPERIDEIETETQPLSEAADKLRRTRINPSEDEIQALEQLKEHFDSTNVSETIRRSISQSSLLKRYLDEEGDSVVEKDGKNM